MNWESVKLGCSEFIINILWKTSFDDGDLWVIKAYQ